MPLDTEFWRRVDPTNTMLAAALYDRMTEYTGRRKYAYMALWSLLLALDNFEYFVGRLHGEHDTSMKHAVESEKRFREQLALFAQDFERRRPPKRATEPEGSRTP